MRTASSHAANLESDALKSFIYTGRNASNSGSECSLKTSPVTSNPITSRQEQIFTLSPEVDSNKSFILVRTSSNTSFYPIAVESDENVYVIDHLGKSAEYRLELRSQQDDPLKLRRFRLEKKDSIAAVVVLDCTQLSSQAVSETQTDPRAD